MSSNNANRKVRRAVKPQRSHGKARVETILVAAAEVIGDKGYDRATMAEIAERAKSPIGSLYRFFPNKEILANALLDRYAVLINAAFDAIDHVASDLPVATLADTLLELMVNLQTETKALASVLEANAKWTKRPKFPELFLQRLIKVLRHRAPELSANDAQNVAAVLMHNLKTMRAITFGKGIATGPDVAAELRLMNRLYLLNRLTPNRK